MKLSECTYGVLVKTNMACDKKPLYKTGMVKGITQNSFKEAVPLVQWRDGDRYSSPRKWTVIFGVISLLISCVFLVVVCFGNNIDVTVIEAIHNISTRMTPFFSYITPVIIALFLLDKMIKKGYYYSTILKKLEEEV